jgi:hypothetical protein
MTNSKRNRLEAIIQEVLEKTSEEYLQARIDQPIEEAAAGFEFDQSAPVTHQRFTQVAGDFVRHVYEKWLWGRKCPRRRHWPRR